MGHPEGQVSMDDVHGIKVTGGSFPAEMWQKFMYDADRDYPEEDFTKPQVMVQWNPFFQSQYAVAPTSSTTTTSSTTPPITTPVTTSPPTTPPTTAPPTTAPPTTAPPTTAPPTDGPHPQPGDRGRGAEAGGAGATFPVSPGPRMCRSAVRCRSGT